VARNKDDLLRFACPQCMTLLKVSPSLAGQRRRCPRCHLVLEVPRKSQRELQTEEYPLNRATGPLSGDQPAFIPVVCEVCKTRIYSTVELVGQSIVCPECGKSTIVPAPAAPAEPAAAPVAAEGYDLFDEAASHAAAVDSTKSHGSLVRVICTRCGTMMYANEDQIGQEILCPDCGVMTVVRPPEEDLKKRRFRTAAEVGDYAVIPETMPPPPPPPRRKPAASEETDDSGLPTWEEMHPRRTGPQDRPPLPPAAKRPAPRAKEERSEASEGRPTLPRWPFLSGTFSFPFSRSGRAVAFVLAAWAILPVGLWQECIKLGGISDGRTLFLGAIYGGIAMILAVMWIAFASACALTAVRDTANGSDEILSWPDMAFVDWMLDPFYLIDSACVSLAPAIVVALCQTKSFQLDPRVAAAGAFFVFPVALLSMLERNSPLGAISLPVYRTFWMAWRGWLTFFILTAPLLAAGGAVVKYAHPAGRFYELIGGTVALSLVWLIYFRFLGRLAWYCAEYTTTPEPEEAEPDEDPHRRYGHAPPKR
jgi:DNA-directed RNA polymerase subunit M/transcription elongation factor TFIIS